MSAAEEIKARLDIVTYIGQYVNLKKAGRTYKAPCPFHHEKTPSFVVNPATQTWRCFGACAEGGDLFTFAMKQHGWSFGEALVELGRLAGVETRQRTPDQQARDARADQLRAALGEAAALYHNLLTEGEAGAAALRYARDKRGFTDDTLLRYQIGYAPPGWQTVSESLKRLGFAEETLIEAGLLVKNDAGRVYERFRDRLMIPIRDERGRTVGFGARALNPDDNPKYLNSPQTPVFDKSATLFGLDTAKSAIRESGVAVIVEGYMDAVQAGQAGFMNVVAQMGTALTEAQLKLLTPRYASRIILALDSDAAGQNATMRSLEVARATLEADYAGRLSVDLRILHIPDAKDPDDLIRETPERWAALIEAAVPVADYVIEVETAGLTRESSLHEREAVARRVLPLLTASESDLYRADNLQKLALRLRLPERDLLAWAQERTQEQHRQRAARSAPRQPSRPRPEQPAPDADIPPDGPPTRYDDPAALEIPLDEYGGYPFADDADYAAAAPDNASQAVPAVALPPSPRARPSSAELEAACLRLLLRAPELLFAVNRRLRELAGADAALAEAGLNDFCADDFLDGDHRALMQSLRLAVLQDARAPLDYLRDHLDPALLPTLDALLVEEGDLVRERMNRRFDGDAAEVWRGHERRVIAYADPAAELLSKALRLRLGRLTRECDELRYAQIDAHDGGDDAGQTRYGQVMIVLLRSKRQIEGALKQQAMHIS